MPLFDFDEVGLNVAWISDDRIDGWENYSLVGTASFDVSDRAELFGQYEYGNLGGFAGGSLNVGTIGLNYDLTRTCQVDQLVWLCF